MKNIKSMMKTGLIMMVSAIALTSLCASLPYSLPEVDRIESGSAEFNNPDPNTLTINAQDKTIINYRSFDILQNETVIINLPSSNNEILNRVIGNGPSQILGWIDFQLFFSGLGRVYPGCRCWF